MQSFMQPPILFNIKTYFDQIYEHALFVCAIWDTHAWSLISYCGYKISPYCFDVCGYQPRCIYAAKAWRHLWHVASILDISITANTTRIISWNFLENIPFPLHVTVLKDQVINSCISYFTNICNVFLCDCFSKLSYCGHFSQKFA